jgi:tRNA-Thr(GGU) m(6)t(6)A37 methyltransferase TsaA
MDRRKGDAQMATVSVRYIVDDVDAAIEFYCGQLGFVEQMHPAPAFAMLVRDDLRLVLSSPGGGPGGGQAMPDGTLPTPGGWNRFSIEVANLTETVRALTAAGTSFRNQIVDGVGGRQILVEDPSGNPVELFEPTSQGAALARSSYDLRPIGHVESSLTDLASAPRQGHLGAPDAWLVIEAEVADGIRNIGPGADLFVLTWLHRSRRGELTTVPGDDPGGPERGVFSTRSPARPNPIGLHRVSVIEAGPGRLRVRPLEAVDGTPVVDIKPVI